MNLSLVALLKDLTIKSVNNEGFRVLMAIEQRNGFDPTHVGVLPKRYSLDNPIYFLWWDHLGRYHNLLGPAIITFSEKTGLVIGEQYAVNHEFMPRKMWLLKTGN